MPIRFRHALLLALLSASCSATRSGQGEVFPSPPRSAVHGRQVNFGTGLRSFSDPDFGRLDEQVVLTFDYCEPIGYERVRLEGGLHYSQEEASALDAGGMVRRLKGESFEGSVGINISTLLGPLRPYVGIGVSMLFLSVRGLDESSGVVFDEEDVTLGGYLKGGLLFQITRTSHLGVEFRHFEGGDASLGGADFGTAYDQVLLVFGTSFR
jgi:hypothetical protein